MEMLPHSLKVELVALFLIAIILNKSFGLFIDYTENTELIQQRSGFDIKLQCGLKGLVEEDKLADIKVHWYFKQCSGSAITTNNCHDFYDDDWTQLPCEESFCKHDLWLRNVTEKYSGLYKCTVHPHRGIYRDADKSLDIQLVRTYQLDVKNTSIAAPEFLDSFPLNKTAVVGAQIVFQCRVHSEVHPTIKWFRRLTESNGDLDYTNDIGNSNFNSHIVRYNGRTYELLATAREKFISEDIYLSKLILNGVQLHDEGYYACVAISYRGYKIREAYLQVYTNNDDDDEYWMDYDTTDEGKTRTDPKEFWLLFLMPLGLAMFPMTVWLCYVIYRRWRKDPENSTDVQYSDEELAQDRCMLRR